MSTSSMTTPDDGSGAPVAIAGAQKRSLAGRRLSRTVAVDIVGFADILAVVAGAFLPAGIYHIFGDVPMSWTQVSQSGLFGGFVAHLWLKNAGYYDVNNLHELPDSPLQLLTAIAVAIAVVIGLAMPLDRLQWHVFVWYPAWLSASFSMILLTRGVARWVLARMTRDGRFDRNIAVYGAGPISRRVHDRLSLKETGVHFVGVYDDRAVEDRVNAEGMEVSGKLEDLLNAAYDGRIDDIVVALPPAADGRIASIVRKLEQAPCNVHIVTHIASDLVPSRHRLDVSQIGDVGLLDVKDRALSDWAPMVKRVEDIVVATLGLVIALPVLAFAAIAIRLESTGPVLFRQRRRGLNREVIEVLKLRTLSQSDTDENVRQVTVGDPRVTRVGRLLRRSSIDELPQLWNVLKGEMSVVGPRPHALIHDEQFGSMLEEYANRHQVKPGITGLAQVKGFRGETETVDDVRGRVAADIAYVHDWSLWLDLKIIARTLVIVLTGKNAH